MRQLLLHLLTASAVLAPLASKSEILPFSYAATFCGLRAAGVSAEDAARAAGRSAWISDTAPDVVVTAYGTTAPASAVIAVQTAYRYCPQHF
jgi:hypothetical protein